jgi:hypothetical protein
MMTLMRNHELPQDVEADTECLNALLTLAAEQAESRAPQYGHAGGYLKEVTDTESVSVILCPPGSEHPVIQDWLTREDLPGVVASFLHTFDDQRPTQDPLVLQTEVEEIWITDKGGELTARKRVYSYDQPNYAVIDKQDNVDINASLNRFEERKRELIQKQKEIDNEEEQLGLNRVSKSEIAHLLSLLGA